MNIRAKKVPFGRQYGLLIFLISILSLFICQNVGALTCDPARSISREKWRSFGKVKTVFAIEPFSDQSLIANNGWLSLGLSEILGKYLSAGKKVGILAGITKNSPPENVQPNFYITGAYQRDIKTLRVFVKVYSPKNSNGQVYQGAFSFSPPDTGRIFVEMKKLTLEIFKATKTNYDKKLFEQLFDATASYKAFESYIKGLEAMWKFDPNYLDVANIWLKDAAKTDIYYQAPYLAQTDIYGYLALEAKSAGKPYEQFLQKLEAVENNRLKFANRPSPVPSTKTRVIRDKKRLVVTNRYLNSNAHYLTATEKVARGDLKGAKKEFEKTLQLVPADSAALYHLSNIYTQLGDTGKSTETLGRIVNQGICW